MSRTKSNVSMPSGKRDQDLSTPSKQNLDSTLMKLVVLHEQTNSKISAFCERQEQTNKELKSLLERLLSIDAAVSEQALRLSNLENANLALKAEVAVLRQNISSVATDTLPSTKSEVIVTGMPSRDDFSPLESIKKVFDVLGISELSPHILAVRKLPAKSTGPVGDPILSARVSYIVTLTSNSVRDMLLNKKRAKRDLKWSEVFEDCADATRNFKVLLNELLPSNTYRLLRCAKVKAMAMGYKYLWTRDGKIYARRVDGQPRIEVRSEEDLVNTD